MGALEERTGRIMGRQAWRWFALIALWVTASGCFRGGGQDARIDYYIPQYETPVVQGLAPLDAVIRLERFSVAPPYNTSRIVFSQNAYERDTYNYHRWRANPGDLVAYFLARDFRESGLFQAVLPYDSRFSASCVLEGAVDEFFERDGPEVWEAVLAVSITLMADQEPDVSRRVLYQEAYREEEACTRKNPLALTEAMSRAMERLSRRILVDVHRVLDPGTE